MTKIALIIILILLAVISCGKKEGAKKAELFFASAEFCADCHEPIYYEW